MQNILKRAVKPKRGNSQGLANKNVTQMRMSQYNFSTQNQKGFGPSQAVYKPMGAQHDSFANGTSAVYMEQMYEAWQKDPLSVHSSWRAYFDNMHAGHATPFQAPPTLGHSSKDAKLQQIVDLLQKGGAPQMGGAVKSVQDTATTATESYKMGMLIRAFQTHGHLQADIDPLSLETVYKGDEYFLTKFKRDVERMEHLTKPEYYGFTQADLDREFYIDIQEMHGLLRKKKVWTLREILDSLKQVYCGKIGIEFMHIADREKCNWIRDKFEVEISNKLDKDHRIQLADRLLWTDGFAQFISQKFNTMKRFGLEGIESFIPGLKESIDALMDEGCEKVVMGMPHRGRLSVLANVIHKPLEQIFAEFQGVGPNTKEDEITGSGDVKYHLGTTYERERADGKKISVTLLANPSHLECVNPVVMGRARAQQHFMQDTQRKKVCPIIIHGDAAFSGQGVVYESINMANLTNYTVGGTIHVIANNQVGFTTTPSKGRSGTYSSDLAKAINAPIFHVNADSVDDVAKTFRVASQYRQRFGEDVVIDLIGYRKFGHNELDAPAFTQPLMYKQVSKMTPVIKKYEKELIEDGVLTQDEWNAMKTEVKDRLNDAYVKSKDYQYDLEDWMTKEWEDIKKPERHGLSDDTGIKVDFLKQLGAKISTLPTDGKFHPQIKKIYEARAKSIADGKMIDWGTSEALAFASLIDEGYHVRISGQDVERGTFSHRHAHVFHQDKDGYVIPINNASNDEGVRTFIASNSHLSEFAVLGYEYGYASANPNTLSIWEAQFGDFANGAQVIIDQFVSSGETKWNVKNGIVMLLPHGYDGNGPEHSSSRIERYLQLVDDDDNMPDPKVTSNEINRSVNMHVCNPSTGANFFHLLRKQMRRTYRKPLIISSPKKLLKYAGACSSIEEFDENHGFQKVIPDQNASLVANDKVKQVILCTGQVYFDLEATRKSSKRDDVAIVRCEQLAPFPKREVLDILKQYKNASVTWAQEEHKNSGVWTYAEPRLRNIMQHMGRKDQPRYVGRPISASTATGYGKQHKQELSNFLEDAMSQ